MLFGLSFLELHFEILYWGEAGWGRTQMRVGGGRGSWMVLCVWRKDKIKGAGGDLFFIFFFYI